MRNPLAEAKDSRQEQLARRSDIERSRDSVVDSVLESAYRISSGDQLDSRVVAEADRNNRQSQIAAQRIGHRSAEDGGKPQNGESAVLARLSGIGREALHCLADPQRTGCAVR